MRARPDDATDDGTRGASCDSTSVSHLQPTRETSLPPHKRFRASHGSMHPYASHASRCDPQGPSENAPPGPSNISQSIPARPKTHRDGSTAPLHPVPWLTSTSHVTRRAGKQNGRRRDSPQAVRLRSSTFRPRSRPMLGASPPSHRGSVISRGSSQPAVAPQSSPRQSPRPLLARSMLNEGLWKGEHERRHTRRRSHFLEYCDR